MSIQTASVTGVLYDSSSTPLVNRTVTFTRTPLDVVGLSGGTLVPQVVNATTDASGALVGVSLALGRYTMIVSGGAVVSGIARPNSAMITIDELAIAAGTVALSDAVGPAPSPDIVTAAQAARDKAEEWATKSEDEAVAGGEYSAKHHNLKAQEAAAQAYLNAQSASQDLSAVMVTHGLTPVAVCVPPPWQMPLHIQAAKSWYGESLNVAGIRGSRRDLPVQPVVIAEADNVRIFDGDDPDYPLWMVFNASGSLGSSANILPGTTITSVAMRNEHLLIGCEETSGRGGVVHIDFASEKIKFYRQNTSFFDYNGDISQRNAGLTYRARDGAPALNDQNVNSVLITIRDDAPMDPATGMKTPTLIVGTDGGTTIIDGPESIGAAVDITYSSYGYVSHVGFRDDGALVISNGPDASTQGWVHVFHNLPTADISDGVGYTKGSADEFYSALYNSAYLGLDGVWSGTYSINAIDCMAHDGKAIGHSQGLTLFHPNPSDPANGMMAAITATSNTGWMIGDANAYMCGTDATDLVETTLNSTTDYPSQWNQTEDGWTINTTSLVCDGVDGTEHVYLKPGILSVGDLVSITFDVTNYVSGDLFASFATGVASTSAVASNGSFAFVGRLTVNDNVYLRSENFAGTVSNIKFKYAIPDYSHNAMGAQVFGTLGRSQVVPGVSDWVWTEDFSDDDYLEVSNDAAFNFGTGPVSCFMWISAGEYLSSAPLVSKQSDTTTGFHFYKNSTSYLDGSIGVKLGSASIAATTGATNNELPHLVGFTRDEAGTVKLWFDGELVGSGVNAQDIDAVAPLRIGRTSDNGTARVTHIPKARGFRIGATEFTPNQIAKMYRDELPGILGQPVTLFGVSSEVNTVSRDAATGLTLAGNTGGASEFSGLTHTNHTTDPASVALAAHNNIIVRA